MCALLHRHSPLPCCHTVHSTTHACIPTHHPCLHLHACVCTLASALTSPSSALWAVQACRMRFSSSSASRFSFAAAAAASSAAICLAACKRSAGGREQRQCCLSPRRMPSSFDWAASWHAEVRGCVSNTSTWPSRLRHFSLARLWLPAVAAAVAAAQSKPMGLCACAKHKCHAPSHAKHYAWGSHVCVCARFCVCMHACVWACVRVCVCVCARMSRGPHVTGSAHMNAHISAHISANINVPYKNKQGCKQCILKIFFAGNKTA